VRALFPGRLPIRAASRLYVLRAMALALTLIFGWHSGVAAAMFESTESAGCCCKLRGEHRCTCPICAHARELASGTRSLHSCSEPSAAARPPHRALACLPQVAARAAKLPAAAQPPPALSLLYEAPPLEVPTPPPLG
jgi:hypothetical protein